MCFSHIRSLNFPRPIRDRAGLGLKKDATGGAAASTTLPRGVPFIEMPADNNQEIPFASEAYRSTTFKKVRS